MKSVDLQLFYLSLQAKRRPAHQGYLYKRSAKTNTTSVRWQKRWCALYRNMLFYYEHQDSAKPQGVIFLEDVSSCRVEVGDVKNLHCFTIIPGDEHRQFVFGCDHADKCDEWVQAVTSTSVERIKEEKNKLKAKIEELDKRIQLLKEEKGKLSKENSSQRSQISRLKLEVDKLRSRPALDKLSASLTTRSPCTLVKSDRGGTTVTFANAHINENHIDYSAIDIKKLVKLQSRIRCWLLQKRWNHHVRPYIRRFDAHKMMLRNRLLFQFFTSEKDYMEQMHTLVNTFLIPMRNISFLDVSCLSNTDANTIFGHSELILVLHQAFMRTLESRMKQWPAVQIDDFLFTILTAVPVYIEYIKNHPQALRTLAECKKRKPFVKLLMQFEKKFVCHGQTLEQFLNYPIRQIPSYIRHIHDVLDVTPDGHPEKDPLTKILVKFQQALTYDEFLDEGESIRHTLMVERLIDGGCEPLLHPDQKFVRHGLLKQLSKHFVRERKETVRYCFLFSQHIIISARTDGKRLRLSKHGVIPLKQTTLIEDIDESSLPDDIKQLSFILTVRMLEEDEPYTVTLKAANTHEKVLWTSDISQCIYNLDLEACDDAQVNDSNNKCDNNTTRDNSNSKEESDGGIHSNIEGERVLSMSLEQPAPYSVSLKEDSRLREDSCDIKYGDELMEPYYLPQILYASVDRLLERLSDPRLPGGWFMETFLLTYRAFTDSKVVMNGLINAYWNVMGGAPNVTNTQPVEPLPPAMVDKKLPVRAGSLSTNRIQSLISNSSMSSIDDLESSFSSNMFPHHSATVFNYNVLKEQLNGINNKNKNHNSNSSNNNNNNNNNNNSNNNNNNSSINTNDTNFENKISSTNMRHQNLATTTKWCRDTVLISTEGDIISARKPRSISACDPRSPPLLVNDELSMERYVRSIRCGMNRSQSVEVVVTHGLRNTGVLVCHNRRRRSTAMLTSLTRRRHSMDDDVRKEQCRSKLFNESQADIRFSCALQCKESREFRGECILFDEGSTEEFDSRTESFFPGTVANLEHVQEADYGDRDFPAFDTNQHVEDVRCMGTINNRGDDRDILTMYPATSANFTSSQQPNFSNPSPAKEMNPYAGRGVIPLASVTSTDSKPCAVVTDLRFGSECCDQHDNYENVALSKDEDQVAKCCDTDTSCEGASLSLFGMSIPGSVSSSITQPSDELSHSVSSNHSSEPPLCTCLEKDPEYHIPNSDPLSSEGHGGGNASITDVSFSISCSPCAEESISVGGDCVPHSQSDFVLCVNTQSIETAGNDESPSVKKCSSLDQKKVNSSPYFGRRRKAFKKDKSRSSSMPNRNVAQSDARSSSTAIDKRCASETDATRTPRSLSKGSRKTMEPLTLTTTTAVTPTSSSAGPSMPISIPGGKGLKKPDSSRRKRSIFKGILKGKGSLKRSSSEMLFTPRSDSLRTQELRAKSTSTFNLTDSKHDPRLQVSLPTNVPTTRALSSVHEGKVCLPCPTPTPTEIAATRCVPFSHPKSASLPTPRRGYVSNTSTTTTTVKKSPVFPVDFINDFFSTKMKNKIKSLKNVRNSIGDYGNHNEHNNHNDINCVDGVQFGGLIEGRPASMVEYSGNKAADVSSSSTVSQTRSSRNRGPLKIMSVFKHWVSKHPKDYIEDPELLQMIENLFSDIKCDCRTIPVVRDIVHSLERSLQAQRKSMGNNHIMDELMLLHGCTATATTTTITMKPLHSFPALSVAENMSQLKHYLFANISFNEFISCQWTKKDKETKAPGIMKFVNFFNQVSDMIKYMIVFAETPASRASLLEFWIQVGHHCRDLNNFNSVMEIVSALNAAPVHRLKKSWELLSKSTRETFSDLQTLVTADRSFKNLRDALSRCNPPCVPYLGCYLSDILFVHEAGETYNKENLINFTKMFRIARIVREVKSYQQLSYTLEPNTEVVSALLQFSETVNDDLLYDKSLLQEPRGS